jgi:hypothetical protein
MTFVLKILKRTLLYHTVSRHTSIKVDREAHGIFSAGNEAKIPSIHLSIHLSIDI